MGLNGKTYEMQYLTDEEKAVINAMRQGGQVDIYFFGLDSLDEVEDRMELFSDLSKRSKRIIDLETTRTRSTAFLEFYDNEISATRYIKIDK